MNNGGKLTFFSPLNIASLLFLVLMATFAIKYNKHRNDDVILSHEKMAIGSADNFLKAAKKVVPFDFSFSRFGGVQCQEVTFEENTVILKAKANPNYTSFEQKNSALAHSIADDLYLQFVYFYNEKNRKNNSSEVIDEIIAGRYPVIVKLFKWNGADNIDENNLLDEFTIMPEDYIPVWKGRGVVSEYFPK